MRKTLIAIAAAGMLAPDVMTATPGVTAFDQQTTAEFRAMGECLAGQVKTRGWVGHGPKDRINALYNEYAETCYDKIKPTAFDDPDHPDGSRAMYTYTGAEWFACHVDDYSAPNRDDEPMTCTDPSTQAYVERIVGSKNVEDSSVPDNTKKDQDSLEDINARNNLNPLDGMDCVNHQDMCERKLKADKLVKALAIRDEDVLKFPVRDVEPSCSFDFHTQALVNACLDNAQPYYNIAKLLWDGTSLTNRKICLLMARQYGKAYQFYMSLGGCLQVKETEADMKRPHKFKAW